MGLYHRQMLVGAIETTEDIRLVNPADGEIAEFVRGFWRNDPKIVRRIVDWGKGLVPDVVGNRYIGDIGTYRNSIRSILFHTRFRGPLKVLVLTRLEEILRNAELFNCGEDNGEKFYNLAHYLSFDRGDGTPVLAFIARLIVKETADGNRTWTVEFSDKKELTEVPTTGEAATVKATRLNPPSTHTILRRIYDVNGLRTGIYPFFIPLHVQELRWPTKHALLPRRLASHFSAALHSPSSVVFKLGLRPRP